MWDPARDPEWLEQEGNNCAKLVHEPGRMAAPQLEILSAGLSTIGTYALYLEYKSLPITLYLAPGSIVHTYVCMYIHTYLTLPFLSLTYSSLTGDLLIGCRNLCLSLPDSSCAVKARDSGWRSLRIANHASVPGRYSAHNYSYIPTREFLVDLDGLHWF